MKPEQKLPLRMFLQHLRHHTFCMNFGVMSMNPFFSWHCHTFGICFDFVPIRLVPHLEMIRLARCGISRTATTYISGCLASLLNRFNTVISDFLERSRSGTYPVFASFSKTNGERDAIFHALCCTLCARR